MARRRRKQPAPSTSTTRPSPPSTRLASAEWIAILALVAATLAWNMAGGSLSSPLHPDERRLVRLLEGGENDWSDPALLVHLGRGTMAVLGTEEAARTIDWGRSLMALFGALSVLLVWRLLRDTLEPRSAFFGAAVLAVCPLAILAAHSFAPDTLILALTVTTVLCLARLIETKRPQWLVLLGASLGLALSTHYASVSLVLLCALAPVVVRVEDLSSHMRQMAIVAGIAAATFIVLNLTLFLDPAAGLAGPWNQLRRAANGDHLYVPASTHWFSFHLFQSLGPGVTTPVLIAAAAGLGLVLVRWRRLPPSARLVLLYGCLVYLLIELSPLKPSPDFFRYVLPILPATSLASGLAIEALYEQTRRPSLQWLPHLAAAIVLAVPAWRSAEMIAQLDHDTRQQADAWLRAHAGRVLREPHSSTRSHDLPSIANIDLDAARRAGITHVATSSFIYDTFGRGSRLANQHAYVYQRHERYQELFEYPYQEFSTAEPGPGWRNPTIRVLDIRSPRPPGRP